MKTRYGLTEVSWNAIKAEMHHILIGLARAQKTISYSALAAQIQTASIHHRAPAFVYILREIAEENVAEGCPNLAALVVRKQTGVCGPGFFRHAAMMGFDVSDPAAFWLAEFERACDFWVEG